MVTLHGVWIALRVSGWVGKLKQLGRNMWLVPVFSFIC